MFYIYTRNQIVKLFPAPHSILKTFGKDPNEANFAPHRCHFTQLVFTSENISMSAISFMWFAQPGEYDGLQTGGFKLNWRLQGSISVTNNNNAKLASLWEKKEQQS